MKDWEGSIRDRKLTKTKRKTLARHTHGAAVRVQGDASSITQHTLAYFLQEYGVGCSSIKVSSNHKSFYLSTCKTNALKDSLIKKFYSSEIEVRCCFPFYLLYV